MRSFRSHRRFTASAAIVALLYGLLGVPAFHECAEIRGWKPLRSAGTSEHVTSATPMPPCHSMVMGAYKSGSGVSPASDAPNAEAITVAHPTEHQHQHNECLLCYFHLQLFLLLATGAALVLLLQWKKPEVRQATVAPGVFLYFQTARARAPPMPAG